MNILFLSLSRFDDVNVHGIYSDLMREFMKRGNEVFIASPIERRFGKKTHLIDSPDCHILKIRTLNIQKTNIVEKGIGMLLLEYQFDRAIRRHWPDVKFDLVLYATPPITFNRVIKRVKKCCGARTYLMLKDIFPQNAVDLGMMKKGSMIYKMFRKKEGELYAISDKIGCMSSANCEYVKKNNPEVEVDKVELCPNAIEIRDSEPLSSDIRNSILQKYGLPLDKTLFVYGGNLGKPQGIDFLLDVVKANENRQNSYILIVGGGTEFPRMETWFKQNSPKNAVLLSLLPTEDYNLLARACDVGLIFLDKRFTIPNFPSRLLSYLSGSKPVLLATDTVCDMGRLAEENGFGFWCEAGDIEAFMRNVDKLTSESIEIMGAKGHQFLLDNYTVDKVADIIEASMRKG